MKRLFTTLSVSFVLSLGLVFAHSEFESSTPKDGAVLTTAPTEVIINFEKDIQPAFSVFKVYALPAEMLADAAMADSHSESGEHSEGEGHSEGESHSEGETHSEGESHSESDTHSESDSHSEEGSHSEESSEHGAMDAAAKMFIPTVIDLSGDEEARADAGLAATEDVAKSVTINLKEDLAPGAYVAMFRILSADTHTVEGFITFEIAE
jgi:methionine-rich copper-binding protein CopC